MGGGGAFSGQETRGMSRAGAGGRRAKKKRSESRRCAPRSEAPPPAPPAHVGVERRDARRQRRVDHVARRLVALVLVDAVVVAVDLGGGTCLSAGVNQGGALQLVMLLSHAA